MNRKLSFLRRGLPAMLLAAFLAGCGGGGGGGTATSPAAAAPSTGTAQHQSLPAPSPSGKVGGVAASTPTPAKHGAPSVTTTVPPAPQGVAHVSARGAPNSTAPVAAMAGIERFAGVYSGEVAREWQTSKHERGGERIAEKSQRGELWINIDTAGQVKGYWRMTALRNATMNFLQGQIDDAAGTGSATLIDSRVLPDGLFRFTPEPGDNQNRLNVTVSDRRSRQSAEENVPDFEGQLRRDPSRLLDTRIDTVALTDTTFRIRAWPGDVALGLYAQNRFGSRLTITPQGGNRWTLENAAGEAYRITAQIEYSDEPGACNAQIRIEHALLRDGSSGTASEDIEADGHCAITSGHNRVLFTLFSTDSRVELWMSGTLEPQ